MQFEQTEISAVKIITPVKHGDSRGFFSEVYKQCDWEKAGLPYHFVQDNHSCSSRDTLRGLHLQVLRPRGKLIRVVQGEIWDVAVDVREGSSTYGRWVGETLSGDNFRQLWIPPGFAHGFCVLSDVAHVEYKCTELYDPADELGIAYDDPSLAIDWPVKTPILSARDQQHGSLRVFAERAAARRASGGVSPSMAPPRGQ